MFCWTFLVACLLEGHQVRGIEQGVVDHAVSDILGVSHDWMVRLSGGSSTFSELALTFNNTFTFTATRTWEVQPDGTIFVHTGDISQMWLRDSSQQIRPYLYLAPQFPAVSQVFSAIFSRMARFFVGDPYASAFNMEASRNLDECPPTLDCLNCSCVNCAPACGNHTYQHSYEMDSFLFVVDLVHRHWKLTGDTAALDGVFHTALKVLVRMLGVEQDHTNLSPYRFPFNANASRPSKGRDPSFAAAKVGLLWGFSRPSDDRMQYNYNIPDNMLAVVVLGKAADLARAVFGDAALAEAAEALAASVDEAIQTHGIFPGNATTPRIYAFEVDGFGRQLLMDDANLPNLLSIPFMGYADKALVYGATRAFVLSPWVSGTLFPGNPSFFSGEAASGLGSTHQSHGLRPLHPGTQCFSKCVWPLGLIMEGLTLPRADPRQAELQALLLRTDDGTGFMHEGFNADDASRYNRDLFGWANSMFAVWVMGLNGNGTAADGAAP